MTTLQEKKIWEIIKEMEEEKKSFFSHRAGQNEKEGIYNNGVYDTICRFLPKLKSLLSETGIERKDEDLLNILIWWQGKGDEYRNETLLEKAVKDFLKYRKDCFYEPPYKSTTQRDEEKKNEPTEKKGVDVCLQCGWPIDHDGHYQNCKD